MIRLYLLTMFALPLLELFDRWKARHTQELKYDGAITLEGKRFGWAEGEHEHEGRRIFVRVFFFNVPLVRQWKPVNEPWFLDPRYGWCKLTLIHVKVRPWVEDPSAGWHEEWRAIEPRNSW